MEVGFWGVGVGIWVAWGCWVVVFGGGWLGGGSGGSGGGSCGLGVGGVSGGVEDGCVKDVERPGLEGKCVVKCECSVRCGFCRALYSLSNISRNLEGSKNCRWVVSGAGGGRALLWGRVARCDLGSVGNGLVEGACMLWVVVSVTEGSLSLGEVGWGETRRDAAWFKEKVLLVQAQSEGKELDGEQLAFLTNLGVTDGQVAQTITHNAAFQTDDLDAYDSDCNDISSAKAVLMANLSSCDSDVLSDVPYSNTFQNDMMNQSVQELQYSKLSPIVDYSDNEITSDSNIIPYS
ncbi:hypothetical protein Tco_1359886 [Tanacetum coccineum]